MAHNQDERTASPTLGDQNIRYLQAFNTNHTQNVLLLLRNGLADVDSELCVRYKEMVGQLRH